MVDQAAIMDRAVRAAKAEPALFDEVEHDENATTQAGIVVVIVAVANAIGAALLSSSPVGNFIVQLIGVLLGWVVWSYICYFVGTRLFNGTATPGELLRTIGYAQAPRVAGLVMFIPIIGPLIALVAGLWSIWVGIVAVRQALDFDTGKAVLTVVIGAIASFVVSFLIGLLLSPLFLMGR